MKKFFKKMFDFIKSLRKNKIIGKLFKVIQTMAPKIKEATKDGKIDAKEKKALLIDLFKSIIIAFDEVDGLVIVEKVESINDDLAVIMDKII